MGDSANMKESKALALREEDLPNNREYDFIDDGPSSTGNPKGFRPEHDEDRLPREARRTLPLLVPFKDYANDLKELRDEGEAIAHGLLHQIDELKNELETLKRQHNGGLRSVRSAIEEKNNTLRRRLGYVIGLAAGGFLIFVAATAFMLHNMATDRDIERVSGSVDDVRKDVMRSATREEVESLRKILFEPRE